MHLTKIPGTIRIATRSASRSALLPLLSAVVLASCAALPGTPSDAPPKSGMGSSQLFGSVDAGGSTSSGQADPIAAVLQRAVASGGAPGSDHRYELARNFVEVERLAEALAIYDELLASDPRDARALDGRGVVLDLMGRHAEAQEAYRGALNIRPDALVTRNNLGLSLAFGGDVSAAIEILREVASHPHATARLRQNLALAYGLAGYDEAAAAVAAIDLDAQAVAENLEYYRIARKIRIDAAQSPVKGSPELP